MSKWFTTNAKTASIAIHNDIGGDGITAEAFNAELRQMAGAKTLHISINSDGGDVSTGFAIYNMIGRFPARKVVTVEGLAASMASVIAMAGDDVVMPSNAMMMIHNPWGAAAGSANEMASFADALDMMQKNIVTAYQRKTKLPTDQIQAMMDRETWLSADDAVAKGFADRVVDPFAMAAKQNYNLAKFKNVPAMFGTKTPKTLADLQAPAWKRFNRR